MISKKKLLRKSRLYLILDKKTVGRTPLTAVAHKLRNAGADLVQLRDKNSDKLETLKDAFRLKRLLEGSRTLFIINDYPDIAAISGADGVHLGQCDGPLKAARRLLGKDKIIGVSCHSLKQGLAAQKNGADYIGIGPVFKTPTKPGHKAIGLRELAKFKNNIRIPYFAIGDISKGNLNLILSVGVKRAAVCRAVLKAKNPVGEIKALKKLLNR
jgi:thiamine-phosphate pyrophosphorylase